MALKHLWLSGLVLICACSHNPREAALEQFGLDTWRAAGKFAYRSDSLTESGNFNWRQQGDNYQLQLYGPLGMGKLNISGSTHRVRIQHRDQDINSDQPANLLYRLTGLEIPISLLPHWLRAQPATVSPTNLQLNADNQIQSFSEHGWQLQYSDYQWLNEIAVPSKITATKNAVQLSLVIKIWEAE